MKYFFPALMAVTILFGVGLTVTPLVAEWLFPAAKTSYQQASTTEAHQALADWFAVPLDQVQSVQAIRQRTVHGNSAWFSFVLPRQAVEQFILRGQLKQSELTRDVMESVFMSNPPPVDWWLPASLQRQTWFGGKLDGQNVALVYEADSQQGFMRMQTLVMKGGSF